MYYSNDANELYRRIERRDIRRNGNSVGLVMIMFSALSVLLSLGLTYALLFSTNNVETVRELIGNDLIFSNITNAIFSAIIFIFPFCFLMSVMRTKRFVIPMFSKAYTSKFDTTLLCFFGFFVSFVAGIVTSLFSQFFSIFFGVTPYVPSLGTSYSNFGTALVFDLICTCLFPALCEEFAMRGVLLNSLRKFGDIPAIVISALVFGLIHGNFTQLPYTFVMGLGLGFITVRSGSIYPAMIVHFGNNLLATLPKWIPSIDTPLTIFLTITSVIAAFLLSRKGMLNIRQDVPSFFSKGKRTWLLISSPVMIVFIIFELILSLRFFQ